MTDTMQYKGYTARVHFDADDDIFWGKVEGIRGSITFHADNVAQLKKEFAASIDFYLESCARRGEKPEKPGDAKLTLRMAQNIRIAINAAAERAGESANTWSVNTLAHAAGVAL